MLNLNDPISIQQFYFKRKITYCAAIEEAQCVFQKNSNASYSENDMV